MRLTLIFWFVISLFLIQSCTPELEDYNSDYKGSWKSIQYNFSANNLGVVNYLIVDGRQSALGIGCDAECELCDCLQFQSGRAKINTSTMEIQVGGVVQNIMQVTQEPFVNEEGEWEMELNQITYFKYD